MSLVNTALDSGSLPCTSTNTMKISIWLIPPKEVYSDLEKQIHALAEKNGSPLFAPHVTLASGLRITASQLEGTMEKLAIAMAPFESIPCRFMSSKGIVGGYDKKNGYYKWSQSTVAIMERDPIFIEAVRVAREILDLPVDEEIMFPPPLSEPHFSFAYGDAPLGDLLNGHFPPNFKSNELVLMHTEPSCLEGVRSWKEVGRIRLHDHQDQVADEQITICKVEDNILMC